MVAVKKSFKMVEQIDWARWQSFDRIGSAMALVVQKHLCLHLLEQQMGSLVNYFEQLVVKYSSGVRAKRMNFEGHLMLAMLAQRMD